MCMYIGADAEAGIPSCLRRSEVIDHVVYSWKKTALYAPKLISYNMITQSTAWPWWFIYQLLPIL